MESIQSLLSEAMKPPSNERTADSARSHSALAARELAMEELIVRLYASARKELPEDSALAIEVRLAMDDLREIPDRDLANAFREAQVQAGGFVPSNGLIVRCWRESKSKGFDDAQKAIRQENRRRYIEADTTPKPEERMSAEEASRFCSEIREQLGPGARPRKWKP